MIKASPVYGAAPLSFQHSGSIVAINGQIFDFGGLRDGDVLPRNAVRCDALLSDVTRANGQLTMTLLSGYSDHTDDAARFPKSLATSGPVSGGAAGYIDWNMVIKYEVEE